MVNFILFRKRLLVFVVIKNVFLVKNQILLIIVLVINYFEMEFRRNGNATLSSIILTSNPLITETILQNLNVMDLSVARQVCLFWKHSVEMLFSERRRKIKLNYYSYNALQQDLSNVMENQFDSQNCHLHPPSPKRSKCSSSLKLNSSASNSSKRKGFLNYFKEIQSLWQVPPSLIVVIVKVPSGFPSTSSKSNIWSTKSKDFDDLHKYISSFIPLTSKLLIVKGVSNSTHFVEFLQDLQTLRQEVTAIDKAVHFADADILCLNDESYYNVMNLRCHHMCPNDLPSTILLCKLEKFLKAQKNLKCFIFFLDSYFFGTRWLAGKTIGEAISQCIEVFLQDSNQTDAVVVGCTNNDPVQYSKCLEQTVTRPRRSRQQSRFAGNSLGHVMELDSFFGIAFCGENVSASSLRLDVKIKKTDQLKTALNALSDSVARQSNEKSNTLVFRAIGEHRTRYRPPTRHDNDDYGDVELLTFHQMFPNTHLATYKGVEVIGTDMNVVTGSSTVNKSLSACKLSSVFASVTIKNK